MQLLCVDNYRLASWEDFNRQGILQWNDWKCFNLCILPEIFGKFYTRRPDLNNIANQANYVQQIERVIKDQWHKAKPYCYSKKENVGTSMIACGNDECQIEWFHVNCLQFENIPKGKWYCPDCHKFYHGKRKKNKNSSS